VVKGFGFIKNVEKSCIYKKVSGSVVVFLILYVDDILLIGNDIQMLEVVKSPLSVVKYMPTELDDCIVLREVHIYRGSP
jgi:hypothetical protein